MRTDAKCVSLLPIVVIRFFHPMICKIRYWFLCAINFYLQDTCNCGIKYAKYLEIVGQSAILSQ